MAVTPTGILGVPVTSLRTTLSELASFQTFTSTSNSTDALAKAYAVLKPATALSGETAWGRPFALVSQPQDVLLYRGGYGQGRLWLYFERDVPAQYQDTAADAHFDFSNKVSDVMQDLASAMDGDGCLIIQPGGITTAIEIQRSETTEKGDYFCCAWWLAIGAEMES